MSTVRILAEQCLRLANGGNIPRDSQFNALDAEYLVRDTAAKLIKGEWFTERNEGGKTIDARYVVPLTGLEVKEDAITKENYINMPVTNYIRLPYGAGIRSVRPDNSQTTITKRTKFEELQAFIPIPNRFEDIYFQLPAGSLEQKYGWMVRQNKIIFTKRDGMTVLEYKIKAVTVDIVTVDPKAIGRDDELPVSGELLQQLKLEVRDILKDGQTRTVDVINDANPNILREE